jgi:hypothetical protein
MLYAIVVIRCDCVLSRIERSAVGVPVVDCTYTFKRMRLDVDANVELGTNKSVE